MDILPYMVCGSTFLKQCTDKNKSHYRYFKLDRHYRHIQWFSKKKPLDKTTVPIDHIVSVDAEGDSIIHINYIDCRCKQRVLIITSIDKLDFEVWLTGLNYLYKIDKNDEKSKINCLLDDKQIFAIVQRQEVYSQELLLANTQAKNDIVNSYKATAKVVSKLTKDIEKMNLSSPNMASLCIDRIAKVLPLLEKTEFYIEREHWSKAWHHLSLSKAELEALEQMVE